jgi:hypothetical protein
MGTRKHSLVLGLLLANSARDEINNIALLPRCITDISIAEMEQEQPKIQYHHL